MTSPILPPGFVLSAFAARRDRYVVLVAGAYAEATTLHPEDMARTWWRLAARVPWTRQVKGQLSRLALSCMTLSKDVDEANRRNDQHERHDAEERAVGAHHDLRDLARRAVKQVRNGN